MKAARMEIDVDAEKEAPVAYARIRGNIRGPSDMKGWPMTHWDDVDEGLRMLLVRMWLLGFHHGSQLMGAGPPVFSDKDDC